MSVYIVNVEEKQGFGRGYEEGKEVLINTKGINNAITVESTKCQFNYKERLGDRRSSVDKYTVTESLANVTSAINAAANAQAVSLDVYPNMDSDQTPVARTYDIDKIRKAFDEVVDGAATGRAIAYIQDTGNYDSIEKVLVDQVIASIYDEISSGSTTTTTTAA